MAKRRKDKITKEDLDKLEKGRIREQKKEHGFFDGRFMTRSQESKKRYKRKPKHPTQDDND